MFEIFRIKYFGIQPVAKSKAKLLKELFGGTMVAISTR